MLSDTRESALLHVKNDQVVYRPTGQDKGIYIGLGELGRLPQAPYRWLVEQGLVEAALLPVDQSDLVGRYSVTLTWTGQAELLPYSHPLVKFVRVSERALGMHPITGRAVAPGRNVTCGICYRRGQAEQATGGPRPSREVWYTNESGRAAHTAAGSALRKHRAGHLERNDWQEWVE